MRQIDALRREKPVFPPSLSVHRSICLCISPLLPWRWDLRVYKLDSGWAKIRDLMLLRPACVQHPVGDELDITRRYLPSTSVALVGSILLMATSSSCA